MQPGEVRSPIKVVLLTMVTCGIYGLIWMSNICDEINTALNEERFNFVKEILLSMVTCGAWGMYFQWRLSEAIVEVQERGGVEPEMDSAILFLMNLFGFGPFFMQQGLNNAWENGRF